MGSSSRHLRRLYRSSAVGGLIQDTTNLDGEAAAHAAPDLDIANDIAGPGAAAGAVTSAPDGVMEPVTGLSPDVAICAMGATDVSQLPTADHEPVDVPPGADVQLNPQPIPPAADLHPPSPCIDELDAAGDAPPAGAEVQLNPQPIPPGIGAEIGEPLSGATAGHAPNVGGSSIIIVGGADASVLAGDVPELGPADDIASTLADDADGPAFRALGVDESEIDVAISEDEFDG